MSKTRSEYGSGVARPKIDANAQFELKGQFLKELHDNTFSGAITTKTATDAKVVIQEMVEYSQKWHNGTSSRSRSTENSDGLAAIQAQINNLGREIKKVNEQVYAAQVGCEQCKGPHYTKDCPLKEEGKTLEEAYYTQLGAPYQPGGQYRVARPESTNATMEILRTQLEEILWKNRCPNLWQNQLRMSKVLQERGFRSLPSSTKTNLRDQVKSISTAAANLSEIRRMEFGPYAVSVPQHENKFSETVPFPRRLHDYCCDDWKEARGVKILEAYDHTLPQKEKDPGSFTLPCFINNVCFDKALVGLGESNYKSAKIAENVLVRIGKFVFPIDFFILDIPEDDDVPLILERPFLSTAHAKIDVFK
ncbi:DNA-directed DNA polymerase [Tanacetum coccineum]